ncbi:tetratricopeptide repeat protein [Gracilimonas mengyeensis]|uniref:ATP-binding protein n=1 Tax=Gracilimonas mengyeensis TaxID=1302730 RepID=UPI00163D909E|nr:tetratricopeptide repeat protein [Gracilimonas mengyeensis]
MPSIICAQKTSEVIPDTTKVLEYANTSYSLLNQGDLQLSKKYAERADSLARAIGYQNGILTATVRFSGILRAERKLDSALVLIQGALETFEGKRNSPDLYNELGNIYKDQGNTTESLRAYQKALEEISLMDSSEVQGFRTGVKMNIASAYDKVGDFANAVEGYLNVIKDAEMTRDTVLWATTLNNISLVYSEMEEYEKADHYLERTMELAREKGLRGELYRANINLGVMRKDQGELEEALTYYERAYALHQELFPNRPPMILFFNMGNLNRLMKNYDQAEGYLRESLDYSEQSNVFEGIYYNVWELGELYYDQGNFEEALPYFQRSLNVAEQLDNAEFVISASESLYKTYRASRQFEEALTYFEKNKWVADSMATIEQERELANMESQLELNRQNEINELLQEKQAQQERRIEIQNILIAAAILILILIGALLYLARKNAREKEQLLAELEKQKKELQELNQAKDEVFAIVSHDLRSPLTSVQGVISLIRDDVLEGEDLMRLIDDIELSIRENVNVIEDLLAWAKDQLSGFDLNVTSQNLNPVIKDVVTTQSFIAIRKKIDLESNVGHEKVLADANALRVIFRNLVSNAIKYTGEGGRIQVESKEEDCSVIVSVRDNGVGIPEAEQHKIFNSNSWTRSGTKKEKGSGFGLSMTKDFVERMGGEIWFESKEAKGTTFYIELPKGE